MSRKTFLITIDSLRSDFFDQNFFKECWQSGLEEFVVFDDAYSNGVATPLAFPAVHTGYPVEKLGKLRENTPTIAELYPGHSFAISNNPHLRPDRGYHRGFDRFSRNPEDFKTRHKSIYENLKSVAGKSDTLTQVHNRFWQAFNSGDDTNDSLPYAEKRNAGNIISKLKKNIKTGDGFYWVHLMDPHHPYYPQKILDDKLSADYNEERMKEANERIEHAIPTGDKSKPSPMSDDIDLAKQIYGDIIKYVNRKIADFFEFLKKTGEWEDSMIIILSDHGDGFGEDGVFLHFWESDPTNELVKVPLAVKYPNGKYEGESFSHPVQNADLLATLSSEMEWGVKAPENTSPLTIPNGRTIISKSNEAVRVSTENGYAIKRGDAVETKEGNVSEEALASLQSSSIPHVRRLSDSPRSMDDADRGELEDRLKFLGYK